MSINQIPDLIHIFNQIEQLMDPTQTLDDNFPKAFAINQESREYLRETAKWAKFIAIIQFVVIGLVLVIIILVALFMGTALLSKGFGGSVLPVAAGIGAVIYYVAILAIWFIPYYFLNRFSTKMKVALATDNETELSESLRNLKSFSKFNGIMLLIVVVLIVGVILLGLLTGGAALLMK